jgi:polar amino acid transport system substrate-binding protein
VVLSGRVFIILAIWLLQAFPQGVSAAEQDLRTSNDFNNFQNLLSEQERNYINGNPLIKVCNVVQASQSNSSIDITSIIAKNSGLRLIASAPYAWQQALDRLKSGDCDILPWATETVERLQTMNFTPPYARIPRVIITRQEQPYINHIELYTGNLFATESNNVVIDLLKQKYPDLRILKVEVTSDGLDMVMEKRAFASISSIYSVGNLFRQETPLSLKIAGKLPKEYDDQVSLATNRKNQLLHSILVKAVENSDPLEINDFISGGAVFNYSHDAIDPSVWWISIAMAVSVSLLLWWNRYLRRLNNELSITHAELQEKTNDLEILSVTDPLTTAFNRLKIDRVFADEISRSERYGQPLSIFMIDIDHYKTVNDNYGHLIGDIVLSKFALILKDNLRSNDVLGRWGGEEFLVICPQTTIEDAHITAEKLRKIIENNDFSPVDGITASFGVTQWHPGETQEMLISKADYAMYLSKHQGRNRVNVSSSQSDLTPVEQAAP